MRDQLVARELRADVVKTDTMLWVGVGGAALVGAYLWLRPSGAASDGLDGLDDAFAGLTADLDRMLGTTGNVPAQRSLPASGPGAYTQLSGPAPVARLGPTGPSGGEVAWRSGSVVGAGALAGAIGPGSVALGAATAGIGAGVAALYWAISSKGLFRGGEEALVVNPARDRYIQFWGPPGTGPGSGFQTLAEELSAITGEGNGSHYFTALKAADSRQKLIDATLEIQRVFASVGRSVPAYVE